MLYTDAEREYGTRRYGVTFEACGIFRIFRGVEARKNSKNRRKIAF